MKKQHIVYSMILLMVIGILSVSLASAQTSTAVSKLDSVKAKIAAKFDGLIAKATNANAKQELTDQKAKNTATITSVQSRLSSLPTAGSIQANIAAKKAAIEQFCSSNPGKCQTKRS